MTQKGIISLPILIGLIAVVFVGILAVYKYPQTVFYITPDSSTSSPIISDNLSASPLPTPIPMLTDKDNGLTTFTEPNINLFQIDIPQDWDTDGKTGCGGPEFTSKDEATSLSICFYNYGSSSKAKELSEFLTKGDTLIKEETITLGGKKAIKKTVKNNKSTLRTFSTYIFADFDKNNESYTLYAVYGDQSTELPYKNQKILDEIISSFKITKN